MACCCQAAAGCSRSRCRYYCGPPSRAPSLALMSAASYSAAVIQRQRTVQVNARRGEPVRAMLHASPQIQGGRSPAHALLPGSSASLPPQSKTLHRPHLLAATSPASPSPPGKATPCTAHLDLLVVVVHDADESDAVPKQLQRRHHGPASTRRKNRCC